MVEDNRILQSMPNLVHVGVFAVDVTDVKNFVRINVEKSISNWFTLHIANKLTELIDVNKGRYIELRERLQKQSPEIEQYIEMKRFLEGEEVIEIIATIGREIKLCRRIKQFEENLLKVSSKLDSVEYYDSLSWVNDLLRIKDNALRKLLEDLPKFKEELGRQFKKMQNEFTLTRTSIKEFDELIDDKMADEYYKKTLQVQQLLEDHHIKAISINAKMEILGDKKNLAIEKEITKEKASFDRFVNLWRFISVSWNIDHSRWKKEEFNKLDKDDMETVINNGTALLSNLQDSFSDKEHVLKLVRHKSDEVRKFKVVLEVVKILKSPFFKDRHWDELFNDLRESDKNDVLGLREGRPDMSKLTLGALMTANITARKKLLENIVAKAKTEAQIEKDIQNIRQSIQNLAIRSTPFDGDHIDIRIITNIKGVIAMFNNFLSDCLNMLADPNNPDEFNRDLNSLVKLLTLITSTLASIQVIQQKLVRFSPVFKFKELEKYLAKKETVGQFLYTVDEFKKIVAAIEDQEKSKSRFFLDMIGVEDEEERVEMLKVKLREIDDSASTIMHNLKTFFKMIRVSSPRYFYITDEQMMTLCSLIKFPKSLMGLVTYLFKGVSSVTVGQVVTITEMESMELTAVVNDGGETFKFREPMVVQLNTHAELPLIAIVKTLETAIKGHLERERVVHTEILANYNFDFTCVYNHYNDTKLPYQLLCLIMQLLFDFEVTMILLSVRQSRDAYGQSARDQLQRFKARIVNSVRSFVLSPIVVLKGRLRDANAVHNLNNFMQLVNGFVGMLDYLLTNNVQTTADFNFQAIPKYSVVFSKAIKVHQDDESKIGYDEVAERVYKEVNNSNPSQKTGGYAAYSTILMKYFADPKSKLVLTMMGHVVEYRYEITQPSRHIAVWPLFEKPIFSIFLAVATSPYLILKGAAHQGKLETVRALASKTGVNYYECDMEFEYEAPTIERFIYGMVSGGYWMTFKNTEKAPLEILSILASFAEEINKNVLAKRATFKWQDQELLIHGGHALFCTYNIANRATESHFDELGNNVTEQFRIIHVATPDYAAIIGSLVSLVFEDQAEREQWTYRLIMFCKLFANISLVEAEIPSGKSKKPAFQVEKFSHYHPSQLADETFKEEVTIAKNSGSFGGSSRPNITMRELTNIISASLIKYFRSLDVYYEAFRERFGADYKAMTGNLKINSDREKKFSTALKKEILNWLRIFESNPVRVASYTDLLDRIFKNDSGKHEIAFNETQMSSQKDILKHISTFRGIFPYPKSNLPESDEKVLKFCEGLLERILFSDRPRQLIILGQPNTQKSTLIRLCSFIESEIKNRKSSLYWLNLDCLNKEEIFGDSDFGGILREILIQTNNINLEDLNKSSSAKINFLFESSNELYHETNDPRAGAEIKNKKNINRQSSWIVFDSNGSSHSKHFSGKVDYLMTIFGNLYEKKEVNQFVGFSSKLRVVYEMHSIAELEPRHVSEAALHYIQESLLSLEDRFNQWLRYLQLQHVFFSQVVSRKVTSVVQSLILPLIEHYTSDKATNDRVFTLTSLSLLNNFLTYFEVFLNEFRKFYISQSLIEARENPEVVLAQRKLALEIESKNNAKRLAEEQFSYGAGMRMAPDSGGISMIKSQRTKKTETKIDDDHVTSLNSKQDIEEFEKRKVEGLAIFCFVSAVYPLLFSRKGTNLMVNIERQATVYCTKHQVNKQKFADGLFFTASDKKVGGQPFDLAKYFYDFSKGKWVSWDVYQGHKGIIDISNSFSDSTFSKHELTRLNCKNTPAFYAASNSTHEDMFSFLNYKDKAVVETSNTKHMRFMLDLFMHYKHHVMLLSDHQQGKSTFLGYDYLPKLVEKRELLTFKFILQHTVSPKTIQTQIEGSLLRGDNNTIMPPQKKKVIIWIDDLQMSSEGEKPESLVRNLQVQQGWFSSQRKNFIRIKDCQFLLTFSLNEYNPGASSEAVGSLNVDVLSKSLLIKTHPLSYNDLNTVFFEQVRNHIEAAAEEKKEKLASKLIHQLVKVVYFNLDALKKLSANTGMNLNLEAFCNLARSLNMIEWETVAEVPENVLFVWYQTTMAFFSSDLDFQQVEFSTIVEEKRAKLTKMIHAPRKSSMFETGARQRLSVKVNLHLVDIIKNRLVSADSNDGTDGRSNKKNRTKPSTLEHGRKTKISNMELIVEEDEAENESSESKPSSRSKTEKSREVTVKKPSGSEFTSKRVSEASMTDRENKLIRQQVRNHKAKKETSVIESKSESKMSSSDSSSRSSKSTGKKKQESLELMKTQSPIDLKNSITELNDFIPGGSKRKSSDSDRSDNSKSRISDSASRSSNMTSSNTDSDSESNSSKSSGSSNSSDSDMGDLSEDLVINEEMIRDEFEIDETLHSSEYFKRFIFNTMKFKLPKGMKMADILKKVCFDKKQIFDEVLVRELKDNRENQDENEDHLFIVADQKDEKDIMEFMKKTLKGYIKLYPDALFALKLDGGNFSMLVKNFSTILMAVIGEFYHVYCSSIKALLYSKTLVSLVCNSVACPADYLDILGCSVVKKVEEQVVKVDAYEHLLDLIIHALPDIWRLKKRVIIINVPSGAMLAEHKPMLDKILDLMSSIILNTDSVNYHLGDKMRDIVDMAKREKFYQHYSEYEIKFTIRNRLEAKLTFILLNDSTETYIEQIKVESGGPKAADLYRYLSDHYPKLVSKLTKVVFNGLKCMEPEDQPEFYAPPLPFEEVEITPVIAKCLNTEMNYLRCVDKDRQHFALVRPHNESIILVNVIKYLLKLKFSYHEGDGEILECNRDKSVLCQKIELRREVIEVEIATIDSQINAKNNEKDAVNIQQGELQSKKLEWAAKKVKLIETIEKLEANIIELANEDKMSQELKSGMLETIKAVRQYKSVDIQAGLWAQGFGKSSIFVLYSILYCCLTGICDGLSPQLDDEKIAKLAQDDLSYEEYSQYVAKFELSLKNMQQSFLDSLVLANHTNVRKSTVVALSKVVEEISGEPSSQDTSMQRVMLKLIDSAIETVKLECYKTQRDSESQRMTESIQLLKMQAEKADQFVQMIDEGLEDVPILIGKIEERKSFLIKKRQVAENSIKQLNDVIQKLNTFQKTFTKLSQPLLDPAINRDALIEYLACYIVIFNKYPFAIKKKLLFTALQGSPVEPSLFESIPIYEMLSTETLLTDAMRNKIPCNANFLANLSIVDMLQDEQTVIYPLIVDKGKMFVKWCQVKFNKAVVTERYLPSSSTSENIEHAMRTGGVFLALDPREDLLRLVRPVIEWQFRRFSENILQIYNSNTDVTTTINYFGKKIPVSKNFFFCIVLEALSVDELDQNLLSKLLVMDNSLLNESLFCETIADELAMNLENNTRGFYVSEYMNKSTQLVAIDNYKKLLAKAKEFDFLKDGLDHSLFRQILKEIDSYELLLEKYDREIKVRKEAVCNYQDTQKDLYSLKILTPADEAEFRFLNYPFAFKVSGIIKMMVKYLPCANRLWIYFLGFEKMRKLVGENFAISYDILIHLVKYSISVSDIKVTSADIEKNSPNFISLFSFVEKRVYQALCSMVPIILQPHFSFLLGVLLLKKKSSRKVQFTEHLSMFLLSEKILARPQLSEILSQSLQKKVGTKLEDIRAFFLDREAFLPAFLFDDPSEVYRVHRELKRGVGIALAKDSELKAYSRSVMQDTNSDMPAPGNKTIEVIPAEETNPSDTGNDTIFDLEARKEISLTSFKSSNQYEAITYEKSSLDDPISDHVVKELLRELIVCHQEMKPREISGYKVNYDQIVQLAKIILTRPSHLPLPIAMTYTSEGDLEIVDVYSIVSSIGIVSNMVSAVSSMNKSPKAVQNAPLFKTGYASLNQMTLVNKTASFREKKDFKSFSELVIAKEKVKKSVHGDFASAMIEYTKDLDKLLFKVPSTTLDSPPSEWQKLIFKARVKQNPGHSPLDLLPGGQVYLSKVDLLSIASLIKYTRPDWIISLMTSFYAELRGDSYLRRTQSIEQIYTFSTNKRITVLLFQRVDFTPLSLVEKMAAKANYKILLVSAVKTRVEDIKPMLEKAAREQSWLVIEGIEILPSASATLMIKEIVSLFEKTTLLSTFRVWVTYKLEDRYLDVDSNVSTKTAKVPQWIGLCYYVFLDECSSVAEEMRNLHSTELLEYNHHMASVINQKLINRDRDFLDTPARSSRLSISGSPSARKDQDDEQLMKIDNLSNENISLGNQNKLSVLPGVEIQGLDLLLEKEIVLVDKKVRCNMLEELQTFNFPKAHIDEFVKNRNRIMYFLKFLFSILRQRKRRMITSFGTTSLLKVDIAKDRQLHLTLSSLLDLCSIPGRGDPYQSLFSSLVATTSSWAMIDDIYLSPALLQSFFKLFITDLPNQDVQFDFDGVKYLLPGPRRFSDFGSMFTDSVLTFPTEDSGRLLGLRPNDERVADLHASRGAFRLLNSQVGITDLVQDHSNYLEDFDLAQFAADNDKPDGEITARFFLNNIEYGYNLIQNHEFKSEIRNDLKKIIDSLVNLFSENSHREIYKRLTTENDIVTDSESDEDSQEEQMMNRQLSISKGTQKPSQRMSILDTSSSQRSTLALKQLMVQTTPNRQDKLIDLPRISSNNDTGLDSRARADNFYAKTGLTPKRTKAYFTFNMIEKQVRDRYRRPLLLHEYWLLVSLLNKLCSDLHLAKYFLEGETLGQNNAYAQAIVDTISDNQVPACWLDTVASLNLATDSFQELIKSVLSRFDSLMIMAVEMQDSLPPIINLSRLLSPKGMLAGMLAANSHQMNVSLANSVLMLFQSKSDTDKVYPHSTVWVLSGLKIRGGRLDKDGRLVNEPSRAKPFDLGALHIEITQFNNSEGETGRIATLINSGEISLMLNTEFEDEKDKTIEFLQEVFDIKIASAIAGSLPKSGSKIGDTTPAALAKTNSSGEPQIRRGSTQTPSAQNGSLNIPESQVIVNKRSKLMTGPTVADKSRVHVVRIPVFLSAHRGYNTLTDLPVFFYCYSTLPQSHWLERATCIVLEDHS